MKNISKLTLFIALFIFPFSFFGKEKTLTITSERNDDRSVTFFYEKSDPGDLVVYLQFTDMQNSHGSNVFKTISGSSGVFHTLHPINPDKSIRYSYKYRYTRGKIDAKPDKEFVYTLPFKKGVKARVRKLSNINERYLNRKVNDSWKAYQFLFKKADTVCAIRKGIVVKIKDGNSDYKKGTSYSSRNNSILIQHEDGSYALYGVLQKGSMMVNIGDKVYPQTPIAIAGNYDNEEKKEVRLLVSYVPDPSYLKKNNKKETQKNIIKKIYIDPVFYFEEGPRRLEAKMSYVSSCSKEIIEKEMKKRERKKYYKNK